MKEILLKFNEYLMNYDWEQSEKNYEQDINIVEKFMEENKLLDAPVILQTAGIKPYCENCEHSVDTETNNNALICMINETIDINVNGDFGCTLFRLKSSLSK